MEDDTKNMKNDFNSEQFKYGVIFGIQLSQSYILEKGKNAMFSVHQFSTIIARDLQEKMDNLSKDKHESDN